MSNSYTLSDYKVMLESGTEDPRNFTTIAKYFDCGLAKKSRACRTIIFIDHIEIAYEQPEHRSGEHFTTILDALLATQKCLLITASQELYLPVITRLSRLHGQAFQFNLTPFSKSEVIEIIQKPALAAGLNFEYDSLIRERLDISLIHQQQTNPFPISVLQTFLAQLYESRVDNMLRYASCNCIGGIEGCFGNIAEETFQSLQSKMKCIFDGLLYRFISLDMTGTPAVITKPIPLSQFDDSVQRDLLSPLLRNGILYGYFNGKELCVSLAHDCLLTHWSRIERWTESNIIRSHSLYASRTVSYQSLTYKKCKVALIKSAHLLNLLVSSIRRKFAQLRESMV